VTEPDLVALNQASRQHRQALLASKICGCFCCLAVFGPFQIRKWIENDATALCPRCDADAVIGDASHPGLSRKTLEEMHHRWFEHPVPDA
jgi:S-formylglutathione hydrolase FrmB